MNHHNLQESGRVSMLAIKEAQDVLFYYLHNTRNLNFVVAEHISKNSPYFLQKLIMKLDTEQDVSRSLTKYLRYRHINEFEPFFESLGMAPSELPLFLEKLPKID
ncbi:hypothetical protein IC582_028952 [Cucumis melo]